MGRVAIPMAVRWRHWLVIAISSADYPADTSLIRRLRLAHARRPLALGQRLRDPCRASLQVRPVCDLAGSRLPSGTHPHHPPKASPDLLLSLALPEYMRRQCLPSSVDVTSATADVVSSSTYCFITTRQHGERRSRNSTVATTPWGWPNFSYLVAYGQ